MIFELAYYLIILVAILIVAAILWVDYLLIKMTIVPLFTKDPGCEIISTGDTLEDAKRIGDFIGKKVNYTFADTRDVRENTLKYFEQGKSKSLLELLFFAHHYGYKLKIKEK